VLEAAENEVAVTAGSSTGTPAIAIDSAMWLGLLASLGSFSASVGGCKAGGLSIRMNQIV